MKKLITMLLILTLSVPALALAEYNVESMTDAELKDTIKKCSDELASRYTTPDGWILLFEYESVQIYQIGEARLGSTLIIKVPIAIINNYDFDIHVNLYKASCNGWEISTWPIEAPANLKKKSELYFFADDSDITTLDDVTSLRFVWDIHDDDYKKIYKQDVPEEHRFW